MASFGQELRQGPFLQIWLTIMGKEGRLLWVSAHLPLLRSTAAPFVPNSQPWGALCRAQAVDLSSSLLLFPHWRVEPALWL